MLWVGVSGFLFMDLHEENVLRSPERNTGLMLLFTLLLSQP